MGAISKGAGAEREPRGCTLMTLHKSKGKEFDGVVIVEGFRGVSCYAPTKPRTMPAVAVCCASALREHASLRCLSGLKAQRRLWTSGHVREMVTTRRAAAQFRQGLFVCWSTARK